MNRVINRKRKNKWLQYLFFFFLLSLIFLFAEFFHTEKDIGEEKNCPICRWENSLFTYGLIQFFSFLLLLIFLFKLTFSKQEAPCSQSIEHFCCRAPPFC